MSQPTASVRAKPRRSMRRVGRGLAALLGVLALSALALLGYLHTASGQELLRRRVESALAARVNGSVRLTRLAFRLGGKLELAGLTLRDAAGQPVIELDALAVQPDWSQLLTGNISIASVSLDGLRLQVEQYSDGSSNLERLLKPRPPSPQPTKKEARRIQIREISLSQIRASVKKPDGSEIELSELAIAATLDAVPAEKTLSLGVSRLSADVTKTSPGGSSIRVGGLSTSLRIDLVRGAGKISLGETKAQARIERPGMPEFSTPLVLGGISADVEPGAGAGALEKLALGLMLIESIELRAAAENGELRGKQQVVVAGLHIDKDRVNSLLGKRILATHVDSKLRVSGEPKDLSVDVVIETSGGKLALDGRIDASNLAKPGYDLKLTGTKLATRRLLAIDTAPDVEVERLALGVKGTGAKRDELTADIDLELGPLRVGRIPLQSVSLRAKLERGVLTIVDLTVRALEQEVRAKGRYVLSDRDLSAEIRVNGDAGKALALLARAGVPVRSRIPVGLVSAQDGELVVEVAGKLDEGLSVKLPEAKLRLAGGRVTLDGEVSLERGPASDGGQRKLELSTVDTKVTLAGVRLSSLLALRGRKLPGMDGRISGTIAVSGEKRAPRANVDLTLSAQRSDDRSAPALEGKLKGELDARRADVELELYRTRAGAREDRLLRASADLPLSGRRLASDGPLDVRLDVPRRTLAELVELLPAEIARKLALPRNSEVEAHLSLEGRTSAPRGRASLRARSRALPGDAHQRLTLDATLASTSRGSELEVDLQGWLDERRDPLLDVDGVVTFPRSPLAENAARDLAWKLAARLGPEPIEALPLPEEKKRGLSGRVGLTLSMSGTRADLDGNVRLSIAKLSRGGKGPVDAELELAVGPEQSNATVDVVAAGLDALRGRARVDVGGRGLLRKLRDKKLGDPALEAELELVRHRLSEWAVLAPKLERVLGTLGGTVHFGGTLKEPLADATLSLSDLQTLDGEPAQARLAVSADRHRVAGRMTLGPTADSTPLELSVAVSRPALREFLAAKTGSAALDVELAARADDEPLRKVVPAIVRDMPRVDAKGTLDWDMTGKLRLASHDGQRSLDEAALTGHLAIERGSLPIPKSKRRFHAVELRLVASREALRLEKLHLEESDREKARRWLNARGELRWNKLRPVSAELSLSAKDFLLFGTDLTGMPDAPRAQLNADIELSADLSRPRRAVVASVKTLDLKMPERFDKAHWPEKTHVGDVIFLSEPGAKLGKLPAPPAAPPRTAAARPATTPRVDLPDSPGTDIDVRLTRAIHIQKPPFEFFATGELKVALRPGRKPLVEGELHVVDGAFQLGGQQHRVAKNARSRIIFSEAQPGELDLYLEKPPHPVVLQDVSRKSAGGDTVRLHLTGPIGKPQSNVTGVGNADLWDILPVHNAGRVKFTSQPDMPATSTVQVPREYDVVLLSYMALNLPHNLFLDRMNAWADPYDDRFAYGRVQHLEADRYSESGKTRVRATARPPTIGQSNAELEAGYLFVNEARTKAGAALVGGSRLGGGPALFFEWSSDD